MKEVNVRDTKKIEALTAQLTKEQGTVAELNKLKIDLESELEEHETMVGELTEQVIGCDASYFRPGTDWTSKYWSLIGWPVDLNNEHLLVVVRR